VYRWDAVYRRLGTSSRAYIVKCQHSAALWAKRVSWAGSCNFPTDTSNFRQNSDFAPNFPKWRFFFPNFCIFKRKFSDKKRIFRQPKKFREITLPPPPTPCCPGHDAPLSSVYCVTGGPSAVSSLSVQPSGGQSPFTYSVSWRAPYDGGMPIRRYLLRYRQVCQPCANIHCGRPPSYTKDRKAPKAQRQTALG